MGAAVLIDPQFYVPDFSNDNLDTYGLSEFRTSLGTLGQMAENELSDLASELATLGSALGVSGVIAPAAMYEAGRPDIAELNLSLFNAAKSAGDALGVPTYASVTLARSVTSSDSTVAAAVDAATAMNADGWYYAFEFKEERVPSSREAVRRCCDAGLSLAVTGRPVLHAYAGPMCLVSYGFGATGVGVGHSQNLWKFTRQRWETPSGQGGGGDAPARFFSKTLWGTVVYPDETQVMSPALRAQVLTATPFCEAVVAIPPTAWRRWDAGKHLVCALAEASAELAAIGTARASAERAGQGLAGAVALYGQIRESGMQLKDNSDAYQENWRLALSDVLASRAADYDYLELM